MSDLEKIKVLAPFKITLYYRKSDLSRNIHFYFNLFGKRYRESTHTNHLQTAEEYAIQRYLAVKNHGKDAKKVLKFEKVVEKFLEFKATKVRDRKLGIKTFGEYERQCRFLVEKFKGKDINSFAKKDFTDYRGWRQEYYTTHKKKAFQTYIREGKTIKGRKIDYLGEVVINRELGLLRMILLFCKDELEIEIERVPTFDKFDENRGRDILTDAEMAKLKEYWLRHNRYYWDIISFCANTGLRYPSELDRCVWKDVDLENKILIVRNRKGSGKRKNGARDMSIPLIGESHAILTRLNSREVIPKGENDFVFINDRGVKVSNISKSFKVCLAKCGITGKEITMYTLRHYFTTKMILSKMPLLNLAHILGHTSTQMIERHYATLLIQDHIHSMQETVDKQDQLALEKRKLEEDKKYRRAMDKWFGIKSD
jgi:integrase